MWAAWEETVACCRRFGLRVMGTAPATGHAAGVAAALNAGAGNPAPAGQVQQELQKQNARLTGI